MAAKIRRFFDVPVFGGWFCRDCDNLTEREEGEQGQPARCQACGSPKLLFIAPVDDLNQEAV